MKITAALDKAAEFLLRNQHIDGSWHIPGDIKTHQESILRSTPIILTSQAVRTLLYCDRRSALDNISKGLYFCLNNKTTRENSLESWAWRYAAVCIPSTDIFKRETKEIVQYIVEKQHKKGYWPYPPIKTYNLTNHLLATVIHNTKNDVQKDAITNWLKNGKAKDNIGWGMNDEAAESESTYTANVIRALLYLKEDPTDEYMQIARKFLEDEQYEDGGWPGSKTTYSDQSTIYSTAIVAHNLMILSESPFNRIVKKSITFLLDNQNEDGGWPEVPGKTSEIFTTYYACKALAFYSYLEEFFSSENLKLIKRRVPESQIATAFLFNRFEDKLRTRLNACLTYNITNSKIIGSTPDAIKRRGQIIQILGKHGAKDVAQIIDLLKESPEYAHLKKKSHITQIKNDVEYLRSMRLIHTQDRKYYLTIDLS